MKHWDDISSSPSSCSSFPSFLHLFLVLLLHLVLLFLLLLLPVSSSFFLFSYDFSFIFFFFLLLVLLLLSTDVFGLTVCGGCFSAASAKLPQNVTFTTWHSGITRALLGHYSGNTRVFPIQHYGSVPWHATRWLCLTSSELLHLFTFKCHFERSPSSSLFSSWNLNMQFRWCGFRNTYFFGLNRSISGKHFIWSPYLSDFYELHFKMFQPANQHKIILYWIFRNISELQNLWSFCEELYFCVDFGFRVPVFGPFHQES